MKKGVKLKGLLDCFSVYASSHVSHLRIRPTRPCIDSVETRNHGAMATLAITTHLISSAYRTGRAFSETPRSVLALERAHASPFLPTNLRTCFLRA